MTSQLLNGTPAAGGDAVRGLSALRKLVRQPEVQERCELCSEPLAPHPGHEHLLEHEKGQVLCSCTPCAMLFPVHAQKRYLRIPRDLQRLDGFAMSDEQWDGLAIPVHMAYLLLRIGSEEPRAFYPSPAGATESLLSMEGWRELVTANPALRRLVPGVEALLVNRIGEARDYYIAPIDRCYELVGLIRLNWRGLSGGQEVWERVGSFFASLRELADPLPAGAHA